METLQLTDEEHAAVNEQMREMLGYETLEDMWADFKEMNKLMCDCGNPSKETTFYDDGEGDLCTKHHYICDDCNLIFQIG